MASNLSRFGRWMERLGEAAWAPQRIDINVQTDRVLVIRHRRSSRVWCQQCGCKVDAVSLQEAGNLAGAAQPLLPGNAQAQAWHICTGGDGEQFACLQSLLRTG